MMPTSENEVKKAILDWLLSKGVFAWRNNTGGFAGSYKGKARFFRFGAKGSGDIFALHHGRFCSIETKKPGKVPTEDQKKFMTQVREHGGLADWFDSVDEFREWWNDRFPSVSYDLR